MFHDTLKSAVDPVKQKRTSILLTASPQREHGFTLHKRAFNDAMVLHFAGTTARIPIPRACGAKFKWIMRYPVPKVGLLH